MSQDRVTPPVESHLRSLKETPLRALDCLHPAVKVTKYTLGWHRWYATNEGFVTTYIPYPNPVSTTNKRTWLEFFFANQNAESGISSNYLDYVGHANPLPFGSYGGTFKYGSVFNVTGSFNANHWYSSTADTSFKDSDPLLYEIGNSTYSLDGIVHYDSFGNRLGEKFLGGTLSDFWTAAPSVTVVIDKLIRAGSIDFLFTLSSDYMSLGGGGWHLAPIDVNFQPQATTPYGETSKLEGEVYFTKTGLPDVLITSFNWLDGFSAGSELAPGQYRYYTIPAVFCPYNNAKIKFVIRNPNFKFNWPGDVANTADWEYPQSDSGDHRETRIQMEITQ